MRVLPTLPARCCAAGRPADPLHRLGLWEEFGGTCCRRAEARGRARNNQPMNVRPEARRGDWRRSLAALAWVWRWQFAGAGAGPAAAGPARAAALPRPAGRAWSKATRAAGDLDKAGRAAAAAVCRPRRCADRSRRPLAARSSPSLRPTCNAKSPWRSAQAAPQPAASCAGRRGRLPAASAAASSRGSAAAVVDAQESRLARFREQLFRIWGARLPRRPTTGRRRGPVPDSSRPRARRRSRSIAATAR